MSPRPAVKKAARPVKHATRDSKKAAKLPARRSLALDKLLASKLNIADFEASAAKKMPRAFFDYYAGGAEDERTLSRNRAGMDRWVLLHRVLVDVSHIDLTTTMLGEPVSMPIGL